MAVLEAIDGDKHHQTIPEGATELEPSESSSKKRKLAKFFEDMIGPSEQLHSLSSKKLLQMSSGSMRQKTQSRLKARTQG